MNKGQIIRTEWDGKWWLTRVVDVDASLVKLEFTGTKRKELVYRGSTRLGPLYREMQQRQKDGGAGGGGGGKHGRQHGNYQRNTNTPYVEYTRQSDLAGKAASITQATPRLVD